MRAISKDERAEQSRLLFRAGQMGCPKCPALPGQRCKTANDKPHAARLRLAQDEGFDAILLRCEGQVAQAESHVASCEQALLLAQEHLDHARLMLDTHVRNGRVKVAIDARRAQRSAEEDA